jgi:hypothetical protein
MRTDRALLDLLRSSAAEYYLPDSVNGGCRESNIPIIFGRVGETAARIAALCIEQVQLISGSPRGLMLAQ